jgi:hypothetical protein
VTHRAAAHCLTSCGAALRPYSPVPGYRFTQICLLPARVGSASPFGGLQ